MARQPQPYVTHLVGQKVRPPGGPEIKSVFGCVLLIFHCYLRAFFAVEIQDMKQWMQELLLAFQHILITDDPAECDATTTPVISLVRGTCIFHNCANLHQSEAV